MTVGSYRHSCCSYIVYKEACRGGGRYQPVGVSKGGLNADGLFVVHERLIELALLLQNGRQVAVRRSKLREYFQGLQVQARRLLRVTLKGGVGAVE